MDLRIREATPADYTEICKLINTVLGYPDVTADKLVERMQKMEAHADYKTFVAVIDNSVVGFAGTVKGFAFEMNGEYMRIIALAVSNEFQSKGIGSCLLKHVENYANSIGINVFALNSGLRRLSAHKFYEKNNYIKKSYGFSKGIVFNS